MKTEKLTSITVINSQEGLVSLPVYISTRGDGPMNFVGHEMYDSERRANRAAFLSRAGGFKPTQTIVPKPYHGARCEAVAVHNPIYGSIMADSIITGTPGLVLTMTMADCPVIVVFDPVARVLGLIHGGWRSVAGGVIQNTLDKMRTEFNSSAQNVIAHVGPGICVDHYEVGRDVLDKFGYSDIKTPCNLNLKFEIQKRLMDGGLRTFNISLSPDCTFHTEDPNSTATDQKLYYSWRREHSDPLNCQMAVVVM